MKKKVQTFKQNTNYYIFCKILVVHTDILTVFIIEDNYEYSEVKCKGFLVIEP